MYSKCLRINTEYASTFISLCSSVVSRPIMPASAPDRSKDETKKCKNFLETLIRLSSQQPQQTLDNVKRLILGLLVGNPAFLIVLMMYCKVILVNLELLYSTNIITHNVVHITHQLSSSYLLFINSIVFCKSRSVYCRKALFSPMFLLSIFKKNSILKDNLALQLFSRLVGVVLSLKIPCVCLINGSSQFGL